MNNTDFSTSSDLSTNAPQSSRLARLIRGLVASYVAQYETPGIDPTERLRWSPVV